MLDQLESKLTYIHRQNVPDTAKDIYQNCNKDLVQLIDTIEDSAVSTLGTLFSCIPLAYEHTEDQVPHFKEKKEKGVLGEYKVCIYNPVRNKYIYHSQRLCLL